MDARSTVAQITGALPNSEFPKVIKLAKPQTDQAITIHLDGASKLDLTAIGNDNVTFVHAGDRLVILFDNHSTVTIEPFYNSNGLPIADISVELSSDRSVSGVEFASLFPIVTDQSILPAAGDASSPASGGHFETVTINQFANSQAPLALLGPEAPTGNGGPASAVNGTVASLLVQGPTLGVHDVAGSEDKPIALSITDALSLADPRTSLGHLTITGVPAGVTLSAGIHNADGSWTLTPAQLTGLTLTSDGEVQHFTLTVTGTTIDSTVTATSAATLHVDVTPVPDKPALTASAAASSVNEDGSVALNITVTPAEAGDIDAVTTVTVSNLGAATLSAGHNNGDGSFTLQIADLQGLTLHPADNVTSGINLHVTASTAEGGTTATSAEQVISLTVNHTVDLALSSTDVTSNAPGTVVGQLTVSDPDDTAFSFTVSNPNFDVVGMPGNFQLEVKAGASFTQLPPDPITITASEPDGAPISHTFTLTLPVELFAADHKTLLGSFSTIQGAVDAAKAPGEFIDIKAGTYKEQVVVDPTNGHGADGLTIEGLGGASVTVQAPDTLVKTGATLSGSHDIDGIFTVSNASNVTFHNLTVDGLHQGSDTFFKSGQNNPELIGIAMLNSNGGKIDGVTVTGIRESDAGIGDQRNVGILALNTDPSNGGVPTDTNIAGLNTLTITNSTIEDFQKGGIVISAAAVHIDNNILTGLGDINNAQNAIQISGSTGDVSNNTISNIGFINPSAAATGILAFDNNALTIDGNSFTGALDANGHVLGSTVGVFVLDSSNETITNNQSHNAEDGIAAQSFGTVGLFGTFTVNGNTSDGVPVGGNGIFFDPNPTQATSSSVFNIVGTNAPDVLAVSPGTDHFTGSTGNDTFLVEQASFLTAADTLIGGSGHNNIAFASTIVGDTLVVGTNVSNLQEIDLVDPNTFAPDNVAKNVDASALTTGLTIVGNNANDIIAGTAGNDTITGGAGTDTAVYKETLAGTNFTFDTVHNNWTVTTGSEGTDTLHGISKVADGTTVATVAGGTVGHEFLLVGGGSQFTTIQEAVNAAHAGDTILIAPGTYTEQVSVVGKNNLTIEGIGPAGSVILDAPAASSLQSVAAPSTPEFTPENLTGVLTVSNATNVTIQGITVNGLHTDVVPNSTDFAGIAFVNATGTVDHVDITGVRDTTSLFGLQRGFGIEAENATGGGLLTVTNSSIEDFQKGGIVTDNLNVEFNHDTFTGAGATSAIAQNAIQISDASGDISNNTFGGVGFIQTPADTSDQSTDVLFFHVQNLTLNGNTINGALDANGNPVADIGIAGLQSSNITINNNQISNVQEGILGQEDANFSGGVFAPTWSIGNTNVIINATQQGLDFEVAANDKQSFDIVGTKNGNDLFVGGAGNDTFTSGGSGNDTFTYNVANHGTQASIGGTGTDTEIVNSTTTATTYNINAINGGSELGIHIESGIAPANVVAATLANAQVTTSGIEEIVLNLGNAGDKVVVNGDLSNTGVATHTITINGGTGNDTVDLSHMASDEDVVATGGGGNDTVDLGFAFAAGTYKPIFDANHNLTGVVVSHTASDGQANDSFTNFQNFVFTDQNLSLNQLFAPPLQVSDTSGTEDHAIALSVATMVPTTLVDPSAALSLTISGIPADAILSNNAQASLAFTVPQGGTTGSITFDATQLANHALDGLTITPTSADGSTFALHVTATTVDGTATLGSASHDINVAVAPHADAPTLTVSAAASSVDEGGTVALNITPTFESDPDATNSVTISGLGTATLNHPGTVNTDGSHTLALTDLNGLTLTAADDDTSKINLLVTASATEGGITAPSTQTLSLVVNPVADAPTLNIPAPGFTTITHPGSSDTEANGINASGQVVGFFNDSAGDHGFLDQGGVLTPIDVAGASLTEAEDINTSGQIVGFFTSNAVTHGFLDTNGVFSTIDGPGSNFTEAFGINASGKSVGFFIGSDKVTHGFFDQGGVVTGFDAPNSKFTEAQGINASGQIVGLFTDNNNVTHGFLDTNGVFTTIDDTSAGVKSTQAIGINDSGEIVGFFTDGTGQHGFLDQGGVFTTINVPSATFTNAFSINDAGQIAGIFKDSAGTTHGFVDTPPTSGIEGTAIALPSITAALSTLETDPDAVLSVVISNIPTDVTFNDANHDVLTVTNGSITLTPAELSGLTVTSDGDSLDLTVTATTVDGGDAATAAQTSAILHVDVTPVADTPTLTINGGVSGNEDTTIVINSPLHNTITAALGEVDPDAVLSITISKIPPGVTFNDANHDALTITNGSITLTPTQLASLTLTSDGETQHFDLTVTATTVDGQIPGTPLSPLQTASTTATLHVDVTPVADAPTLNIPAPGFVTLTDLASVDTEANGINASGQVVGFFVGSDQVTHGFFDQGGALTTFDDTAQGVTSTQAQGINASDQIVGFFTDGSGQHGFLDKGGVFTTIDAPNSQSTAAFGINTSGQIVGFFTDNNNVTHGFLRDTNGNFQTIDDTSAFPGSTFNVATGINASGQIVGAVADQNGLFHGFLRDTNGTFHTIDDNAPDAIPGTTQAFGINDAGDIVGTFADGNGQHGFLDKGGVFTTIDVPGAASGTTQAFGINDAGQIVGIFQDSASNNTHGFVDTPPTTGNEGTPIALPSITTAALSTAETDPDAALSVAISNLPNGIVLNQGTFNGATDTLTLTPAQLNGLTLTSDGENQHFDLKVTATTVDGGDAATAASTFAFLHVDIVDNIVNTAHVLTDTGGAEVLIGSSQPTTFLFDTGALTSAIAAAPSIADVTNYNNAKGDQIDLSALLDAAFGANPNQPASNLVKVTENVDNHSATLSVDTGAGTNNQFVAIAHLDNVHSGDSVTAILDLAHHTAQLHVA
ncbi:MAG TPA: type I secretion C-terminal target domain-containing protein [Bradyrhizobium sp.]|nr:type I secretion C-terminal target domain-containing protein [Bradyrhizobium sp.]